VLLAKAKPKDLSIEALRSFRTSLQIAMHGTDSNIFCISGLTSGVGKSFVSANLAYLLATSHKRMLLIDGDIRKGTLAGYFCQEKPKLGLAQLLAGKVNLDTVLLKEVAPGLDFIPAGEFPNNPSELLMKDVLGNLLEKVSPMYDLILIDTPPILAVTDATIIAQHVGSFFLVLGAGVHTAKEVSMSLRRLDTHGVTPTGAIFNFAKRDMLVNKYGYNYGYYSHYQYQYEYK
jgi:tyrosine-protein kinase Etk/Wzc